MTIFLLVILAIAMLVGGIILFLWPAPREKESKYHDPKTHFYQAVGVTKPAVPHRKLPPFITDTETKPLPLLERSFRAYQG